MLKPTGIIGMGAAVLLGACAAEPSAPAADVANTAGTQNAAIIETGEFTHTFGIIVRDWANHLALYYRWDDGFCGGVAATDAEYTTYRDIIRIDQSWISHDKDDGMWFYVYPWNGEPIGCAFLKNTTPLATGRGRRMVYDNDYYAYDPYAPGPGANAYMEKYIGQLTTPAGDPVGLEGQTHVTVDGDGYTVRTWRTTLQLSPDPRN